jgi:tetratricopeptide (TPR) repeat protein
MLTEQGHAKVMDFGLAKKVVTEEGTEQEITSALTHEGSTLGTLAYMSPEQVKAEPVDHRSDIFSFGIVLYEMLAGVHPFRKARQAETTGAILLQEPAPLARYIEDMPELLQHTVSKMLAKDKDRRYQVIHEVRTNLKELLEDTGTETTVGAGGFDADRTALSPEGDSSDRQIFINLLRRHKLVAGIGLLLAVSVIVLGLWALTTEKAFVLAESDELLITDFVNTTGDDVFDGALKTALRVKLDESPYLNIVSDSSVRETLGYMDRPAGTQITPEIGREICQRRGNKAVMVGEIAQLGSTYLVTLNAEDCQTGDSLAQTHSESTSKEEVLQALDSATTEMRGRLGESLASIEKMNTPLREATTSSLEALKAYTKATEMNNLLRYRDAIAFAQRAVELDPSFASAYRRLSANYWNLSEITKAREYAGRAYELRERASELERFSIEENYHWTVLEDFDRTAQILELATQTYPDKRAPFWSNLAITYYLMGKHERALECQLRYSALRGTQSALSYNLLGLRFRSLGRLSEARTTLTTAISEGIENTWIHRSLYEIAFLEGDEAAMQHHADWVEAHPNERGGMEEIRIKEAYMSGQFQNARELLEDWALVLTQKNQRELASNELARHGWREAVVGHQTVAIKYARRALEKHDAGTRAQREAALALAASGELVEAQETAAEISREYPQSTLWQGQGYPTIQAIAELRRNNPEKALELLRPTRRFEINGGADIYTRGRAFLALKQGEKAAAEFQKILNHRGITGLSIEYPLAHLGLARAKILMGYEAGARKSYEEFLEMWKDADPDVPILIGAKAEYEKLTQGVQ